MIYVWKYEKDKVPTKEFGDEGTQDVECWMTIMSFRYAHGFFVAWPGSLPLYARMGAGLF